MTVHLQGRPTVPDVLPLVQALYRGDDDARCTRDAGGVGGHLHIVLDDGNVETGHVQFCLNNARDEGCATCLKIAELLLRMTVTQRGVVSSRAYEPPAPPPRCAAVAPPDEYCRVETRCGLLAGHTGPHTAQLGPCSTRAWSAVTFPMHFKGGA